MRFCAVSSMTGAGHAADLYCRAAYHLWCIDTSSETMVDERTPIHAVWRQKNHRLPKIEAFLNFLRQLYSDTPYWDIVTAENKRRPRRQNNALCPVDFRDEKTALNITRSACLSAID